jgi:cysteine desulfurase
MTAAAYLDHNATTPVRPQAAEAVALALAVGGNPSAVHGFGRAARRLVDDAREQIAVLVGADPAGVIFTSGGTEANALALAGLRRPRILASAIEHSSVLDAGAVERIPVDWRGALDLEALDKMLAASTVPALVAVMLANNETGVIQPVAQAAHLAHEHGAFVHCDAIQAAGRVEIDMDALEVDSLSLSAHKLGGPMGAGALVLADPLDEIAPLLHGGAQEHRRRAGTENVPGIAGFGAAVAVARSEMAGLAAHLTRLRDGLERRLRASVPSLNIFGDRARMRVPNTSCFAVPGIDARTLVMALDLEGVAVSAGAACSSGKVEPSHVLAAMGAGPLAGSAIRVSLGWTSVEADIDAFCKAFTAVVGRLGAVVATAA